MWSIECHGDYVNELSAVNGRSSVVVVSESVESCGPPLPESVE